MLGVFFIFISLTKDKPIWFGQFGALVAKSNPSYF